MNHSIVICADDYAISPGTSAVIRELLAGGLINATTCLVEPAIWPAEAAALRALVAERPGIAIGLHLNLTEAFGTGAGEERRPLPWWLVRALSGPSDASVARALSAYRRQWEAFAQAFGRPPDFLDGHQHVHLYGPARHALFALIRETGFCGWVRQCGTSSSRFLAQRILMDSMSRVVRADARLGNLDFNPGFGGLRGFRRGEDLARLWRADLAGLAKGGLLIVHPGASGSPPGTEAIDSCREDEARALRAGLAQSLMAELGLALAPDARRPDWPSAP